MAISTARIEHLAWHAAISHQDPGSGPRDGVSTRVVRILRTDQAG